MFHLALFRFSPLDCSHQLFARTLPDNQSLNQVSAVLLDPAGPLGSTDHLISSSAVNASLSILSICQSAQGFGEEQRKALHIHSTILEKRQRQLLPTCLVTQSLRLNLATWVITVAIFGLAAQRSESVQSLQHSQHRFAAQAVVIGQGALLRVRRALLQSCR